MNCVNQFAWLDYTESGFGLAGPVCGSDQIRVRNTDENPIKIFAYFKSQGWAVAEQLGKSNGNNRKAAWLWGALPYFKWVLVLLGEGEGTPVEEGQHTVLQGVDGRFLLSDHLI